METSFLTLSSQEMSYSFESKSSSDRVFKSYVCSEVLDLEEDTTAQALDIFDEYSSSSSETTPLDDLSSASSSTSLSSIDDVSCAEVGPLWEPARSRVSHNDASALVFQEQNPYSMYRSVQTSPAISNSDILYLEGRSTYSQSTAPCMSLSSSQPRNMASLQNDFHYNSRRMPLKTLERYGKILKPHYFGIRRRNRQHPDKCRNTLRQSSSHGAQWQDMATCEFLEGHVPLSSPGSTNYSTGQESTSLATNSLDLASRSFGTFESTSLCQRSGSSSSSRDVSNLLPRVDSAQRGTNHFKSLSESQGQYMVTDDPIQLISPSSIPTMMSASGPARALAHEPGANIPVDAIVESSPWLEDTAISYSKVQEASQTLAQVTHPVVSIGDQALSSFFLPSPSSSFSVNLGLPFQSPFSDSRINGSFSSQSSKEDFLPQIERPESSKPNKRPGTKKSPTPICRASKSRQLAKPRQIKPKSKRRSRTRDDSCTSTSTSNSTDTSTTTSKSSSSSSNGREAGGFVNFTPNDSDKILCGVAPSGSSKTKLRREREAREQRQQFQLLTVRAAKEGRLERLLGEVNVGVVV